MDIQRNRRGNSGLALHDPQVFGHAGQRERLAPLERGGRQRGDADEAAGLSRERAWIIGDEGKVVQWVQEPVRQKDAKRQGIEDGIKDGIKYGIKKGMKEGREMMSVRVSVRTNDGG